MHQYVAPICFSLHTNYYPVSKLGVAQRAIAISFGPLYCKAVATKGEWECCF
jgi:hypothetical protein